MKITALPAAAAPTAASVLPAVTSGVTEKVTLAQVATATKDNTQTLTNKTLVLASNTLTDTSAVTGDIAVHNGTRFVRRAKGAAGTRFGTGPRSGDVGYLRSPHHQPLDLGRVAFNYDPADSQSSLILSSVTGTGTLYIVEVPIEEACTITNIDTWITNAGATLTVGQCKAALYASAAGAALIGVTADQAANWQTTGLKEMAIVGGPVAVSPGLYYVGLWWNGTTAPTLLRRVSNGNATNYGRVATTARVGTTGIGITTTAPATLAVISAANSELLLTLS